MASAEMAVHSSESSAAFHHRTDVDRLLAGYRAARAQEALFDLRPPGSQGPVIGYDEFVDEAGNVRPAWTELADAVGDRGRAGLNRLNSAVHRLVDNDDITYTVVMHGGELFILAGRPSPVPPTSSPGPGTWTRCHWWCPPPIGTYSKPGWCSGRGCSTPCSPTCTGAVARSRRVCCRRSCCSPTPVMSAPPTESRCRGTTNCSCTPVMSAGCPDLYERVGPRPTTPFAQALRLALIDAAPDGVQDPVVVVLSPGIYSETAFDQAYLATLLGFPLVESTDLVVRDGKLWMRSLGTLKRVDVVFRRVDATYTDRWICVPIPGSAWSVWWKPNAAERSPSSIRWAAASWKAPGCNGSCPSWPSGCSVKHRCWPAPPAIGAVSTANAPTCWRTSRRC